MANVIDDTENGLVLAIVLVVMIVGAFILYQLRSFFFGADQTGTGLVQSVKNTLAGFPDGADPGTVPAAQYMQGIVESFRNAPDLLFGADDLSQYVDPDSGGVPPNYVPPTALDLAGLPGQIGDVINTALTNPGSLPMF